MKKPILIFVATMSLAGCATEEYVQQQVKPLTARLDALEARANTADAGIRANAAGLEASNRLAGEMQQNLRAHADRIAKSEADIALLSRTAQDAVQRAADAGRMAQGKIVYEIVLTNSDLRFPLGSASLPKSAETPLEDLAARLKTDNTGVYIELQGHTDNTGGAEENLKLGEARAEAVRRHLNLKGGIPLHRMSVISYGESAPVADNRTRAGREQNRRVVMVIIK